MPAGDWSNLAFIAEGKMLHTGIEQYFTYFVTFQLLCNK